MPPAARITDPFICPRPDHVAGVITAGTPKVLIGMLLAARAGDAVVCAGGDGKISAGSSTVLVDYAPAARMGDPTDHGGVISAGFPQVLIG